MTLKLGHYAIIALLSFCIVMALAFVKVKTHANDVKTKMFYAEKQALAENVATIYELRAKKDEICETIPFDQRSQFEFTYCQ